MARVIWRTPFYADYNWTVRPDVDEMFGDGFTDRLQQALLAIDDPGLLTALPRQRLIAALDMLKNKRQDNPAKKHGNIPL